MRGLRYSRVFAITLQSLHADHLKPGISARHCSRLSAHIAYGTLSVREIDRAAAARQALLADEPNPGSADWARQLQAFRSRLAWRCHFVQKLEQQPEIEFRCMHPAFEGMRENEFRADFLMRGAKDAPAIR